MNLRMVVFVSAVSVSALAQTTEIPDSTDQRGFEMESLLEEETEDSDDSQLVDLLSELQEHPLDINAASAEELGQLPGLHELLLSRILKRRETVKFNSIRELKEIEGFTEELFRMLRHYLKVGYGTSGESAIVEFRSRTVSMTKPSRGFQQHIYSGSPIKSYNRIQINAPVEFRGGGTSAIRASAITEKDAGERMGDFTSGYVDGSTSMFRLIVGDFSVESGAGLVFPRKYSTFTGAEIFGPGRIGTRIKGYSSTEENFFFRGALAEARASWARVALFVSKKPVNGTIDSSGSLVSLDRSGLFRTETERKRKAGALQTTRGGYAILSLGRQWKIGVKLFISKLDHPPAFRGLPLPRTAGSFGLDVEFLSNAWTVFGEMARNRTGSTAAMGGVQIEPDKSLELLLVVHSRPKSFENVFRVSFENEKEQGIYAGLTLRIWSDVKFRCSLRREFERWNNSVSPFPLSSGRLYAGIELNPGAMVGGLVEFREKESSVSPSEDEGSPETRSQQSLRVSVTANPTKDLQSQSRIELGSVAYGRGSSEGGILILQDLQWKLGRLSFGGRMVFFETGSYDSRLYEYEEDLRGTSATPALYGRGIRSYVLLSWQIFDRILLGVKYSTTLHDGVRVIGSGFDEIQGDVAGSIAVQVDMRF